MSTTGAGMAPGELNEVSQAIGALQARMDTADAQRGRMDSKIDTLLERTACLPDLKRHVESHCDDLDTLNTRQAQMRGMLKGAKSTGFAIGTALMAGVAGLWALATQFGWFGKS